MRSQPIPIARVRLARSYPRLLAAPLAALLAGGVAIAGGALLGGLAGIALAIAGLGAAGSGILLAIMLLTLRLEVEVGAIRVGWWGGERRYRLARGSVTRVAATGANAPRLRVRFGALGWAFGPGVLRDAERIEVVRLAPRTRLILLPTVRGRLAVAPAAEQELLEALTAAARVQQRLDANAELVRPVSTRPVTSVEQPVLRREPPAPAAPEPPREPTPRLLTGIERAQVESRLAFERERRSVEAARRAELQQAARRAAEEAATRATAVPLPTPQRTTIAPARQRRRARWQAPGWLRRPSPAGATGEATADVAVSAPDVAVRAPVAPPRERPFVRPSLTAVGLMLLPSMTAGVVWLAVNAWVMPATTELRQLTMALVLAGPAASIASVVTWLVAPRLSGLPLVAGMAALLLVGRALLP